MRRVALLARKQRRLCFERGLPFALFIVRRNLTSTGYLFCLVLSPILCWTRTTPQQLTTMSSAELGTGPALSEVFSPTAPLTDDELAASLLAVERYSKSGGPEDTLWIPRQNNSSILRKDAAVAHVHGWSPSELAWLKEYHNSRDYDHPSVLPSAVVSGEATLPRRIKRLRDQGVLYPHFEIPRTLFDDIKSYNPFVITSEISGKPYTEQFRVRSEKDDAAPEIGPPPDEEYSFGCIGWSFSQKRRFVRTVALQRISLLCLRSRRIRGAGDEDPRVTMPHPHTMQMYSFFDNVVDHTGPWPDTKAAIDHLWEIGCISQASLPEGAATFRKAAQKKQKYAKAFARTVDREMDPERPYVLDHGDLHQGFNIMTNQTRPTGLIDFERSTYVPYAAAIHDIMNTYPIQRMNGRGQVRYVDGDEWASAPGEKPFSFPTESRVVWQTNGVDTQYGTETFDEYHSRHPAKTGRISTFDFFGKFDRTFDFRSPEKLERYGRISWEDFASGDFVDESFDCVCDAVACPMARMHQFRFAMLLTQFPRVNDPDARAVMPLCFDDPSVKLGLGDSTIEQGRCIAAARSRIARFWFYPPVAWLVTQFVQEYFNPDPLLKWQDPTFHAAFTGRS